MFYPAYQGKSINIIVALQEVGENDVSFKNRRNIAAWNGIKDYAGKPLQNTQILNLLKKGKLKKR